jgi:huntingtin interacting protein 1
LIEKADLFVNGNGKLEEIIVCSNEIAASTAQLVVASNVNKFILRILKFLK